MLGLKSASLDPVVLQAASPPCKTAGIVRSVMLGICQVVPKDPCTYIVYSWALKLLDRNPFKAQVYTI